MLFTQSACLFLTVALKGGSCDNNRSVCGSWAKLQGMMGVSSTVHLFLQWSVYSDLKGGCIIVQENFTSNACVSWYATPDLHFMKEIPVHSKQRIDIMFKYNIQVHFWILHKTMSKTKSGVDFYIFLECTAHLVCLSLNEFKQTPKQNVWGISLHFCAIDYLWKCFLCFWELRLSDFTRNSP